MPAKITDEPIPVPFGPSASEALGAAIDAARLADPLRESPDGRQFVALPDDFNLKEIPDDRRLPPRPKASVEMDVRASLAVYVNRFQSAATVLMADYDSGTITAMLDWHPANDDGAFGASGAVQHRACLRLRPSEEFARWNAMEGKLHSQEDFARFLEENSADIATPNPSTMIEISRDLEATVGQSIKASTRLESGDRKFLFQSETTVTSDVVVPRDFSLDIPVYQGEDPEILRALFRFRATPGGLTLGFQWHRVEYLRHARFALIANDVAESTGRPVIFGRTKS